MFQWWYKAASISTSLAFFLLTIVYICQFIIHTEDEDEFILSARRIDWTCTMVDDEELA